MASIKNLVNFAAKFFDMGKDKKKAKAKPTAKSKSKPAAKKASKPVAKKTAKPVKKAAKPAAKKSAKPVAKKATKPVAKKTAKPVAKKKVVKKAVKKAAKPVAKKVVKKAVAKKPAKPVAKAPVKKSAPKPKPIAQKQVKQVAPAPKVVAKKETKPAAKPAAAAPQPKPMFKPNVIETKRPDNTPKMRYSDEDLKEFRELIEGKLTTAREELKNLKEALDNHTESQAGNKAWNMEEGTDTSEMEYLMNQISRQHQYIRNLELALVRVENKTYGICRVSGNLIPKERLRVVPHATMSLEAKMNRKTVEENPAASAVAPPTDFAEGFEE